MVRLVQVFGVAFALGGIPYVLGMDADGGARATLVVMHVVMAPVAVGALEEVDGLASEPPKAAGRRSESPLSVRRSRRGSVWFTSPTPKGPDRSRR